MTARALPLLSPFRPFWLSAVASSGDGLIGKAVRVLKRTATGRASAAIQQAAEPPGPPETPADVERFRRLLLPLQDDAYAFALHLCRDASAAEDLAQEAYLKAYRGFSGYRGGDPKAWLLAIVRSCFLDWARGKKAWAAMVESDGASAAEATLVEDANAEELMVRAATLKELRQAIEALPQPFRETLVLRELQELNYRQIAEITGAPIGTVMSRLARARGMLIAALRPAGAAS